MTDRSSDTQDHFKKESRQSKDSESQAIHGDPDNGPGTCYARRERILYFLNPDAVAEGCFCFNY